ncbi:MAG: MiaB/RimO family radical SAM methylthiotransferase [Phycisphaerales bacterium]|nr:MiaB/RimO family radical SAM methylthiotransferase [Phycisphaerales bacterium]
MLLRTFSIQTLGCKVNQYESEQVAVVLRSRGMVQVRAAEADLRIVNTCSVTTEAAAKSRQISRRMLSLPVLGSNDHSPDLLKSGRSGRVIVMGCWATSNPTEAAELPGVDAILTHHDDVAGQLHRLLNEWTDNDNISHGNTCTYGGIGPGTSRLPLLDQHQQAQQRAFIKVQDGCDAHCTYCIIPQLRPNLWSKPVEDVVKEAGRLVACGHKEIILSGIFLSAYGRDTALRRRQPKDSSLPLGDLISALCTQIDGLRRVRLSSLEPGDLTDELISVMRQYPQVVPHFHLPLQCGSDRLLRRMNRQYGRDDFIRMVDRVNQAFDRPALTTDIIVGFPGETDEDFNQTLRVMDHARFIHVHAFVFSARPGTAAARWTDDFVPGPIARQRLATLTRSADSHGFSFRQQFVGKTVELLVEQPRFDGPPNHGRCERYFEVHFDPANVRPGQAVKVQIENVTMNRTTGRIVHVLD